MNQIEKQIFDIIQNSPLGIKAKDIAFKLNLPKSIVNDVLREKLKKYCDQDSSYRWFSRKSNNTVAKNLNHQVVPDKALNDICRYYLNCLSLETNSGISEFLTSNFSLKYAELPAISLENQTPEVARLIQKISGDHALVAHIGYPSLIQKKFSTKTNQCFYKIAPVFLFSLEIQAGAIQINPIPRVNMEIIKQYSSKNINDSIYDLISLENELGLNEAEAEIEIDELVARLQEIRQWEYKERLDPNNISILPSISTFTEEGIYNRAILVVSDKSPYTVGLESELLALSKLTEEDYVGTALYAWLHPDEKQPNIEHPQQKPLLEVLPTNIEQEYAIQAGLYNNLTIVTGPPGTGKSQVVTNLLANIAWNHKNALFTSKNNKAVDVVETRINALGKRPIMFRIGGEHAAQRLAEAITNLLSFDSSANDEAEYDRYKEMYESSILAYNNLLQEKEKNLALRNQVDRLEQKFCEIREKWSSYFHVINTINANNFDIKQTNFLEKYDKWSCFKKSLIGKILWFALGKKKTEHLNKTINELNLELEKYDFSPLSHITEILDEKVVNDLKSRMRAIAYALNTVAAYKSALQELSSSIPLEIIDKKISELKTNLSDIAIKLWQNWLLASHLNIDSACRRSMAAYVTSIQFLHDANISQFPALNRTFKQLQQKMAGLFPCWAVTSLSAKGRVPFQPGIFELVVIDEASQCDIASVIPMLFRAKRSVIIGDPKQLSHISTISKKQDLNLLQRYNIDLPWSYTANSLYSLANSLIKSKNIIHLRDHHRSYADIIEFSNNQFYDGKLRIATNYDKLKYPKNIKMGIRWVNVVGKTIRPSSGGAYNEEEAQKIVNEIKHLVVDNNYLGTVGVVTPFRKQADRIKELIEKNSELNKYLSTNNDFLVDTVHKFQGDEKDIIFFSPVISEGTSQGAISFLNNTGNLFNVAITRAKSVLVVVGDQNYCLHCGVPYMENFVSYAIKQEKNSSKTIQDYNETNLERIYPKVSNPEQVSEWEKILYTALFEQGIRTIPQYPIDKYKLDLAIIAKNHKLDIEVDGEMYHKDWNGELSYRDRLRNQRLYELGWDIKRFWVYEIRDNLPECIKQVKQWVEKHRN